MPTVTTTDGTEIFYKDWGSGQPIMFHHGWPLSSDDWDTQLMFFVQRGYRVIAHDRRGHGRSSQAADGHDMDHYAADAAAVVEHLDLHDAVHVGHSTGGGEVARYVARHGSGRVAKAVLIGAVPPLMLQTEANPGGLPIEVFDSFREGTGSNRSQFFLDVASGPFYGFNRPGAKVSQGVIWNWWRQGMMGGAKAHYDGIKAFSETDFTEDLQNDPGPDPGDARRRRPGRPDRRLGRAVDQAAQGRDPEGLPGLPARHVHHPRRRHQRRTCSSSSRADRRARDPRHRWSPRVPLTSTSPTRTSSSPWPGRRTRSRAGRRSPTVSWPTSAAPSTATWGSRRAMPGSTRHLPDVLQVGRDGRDRLAPRPARALSVPAGHRSHRLRGHPAQSRAAQRCC